VPKKKKLTPEVQRADGPLQNIHPPVEQFTLTVAPLGPLRTCRTATGPVTVCRTATGPLTATPGGPLTLPARAERSKRKATRSRG
jgi:hypothetical protein